MNCWQSIREAPPAMWVFHTYARAILRKNEAHTGIVHTLTIEDPEHVSLGDDIALFAYPNVTYAYAHEKEILHEHRHGSFAYRAYTRDGTIGWITRTLAGSDPLATFIGLPTPPRPELN